MIIEIFSLVFSFISGYWIASFKISKSLGLKDTHAKKLTFCRTVSLNSKFPSLSSIVLS